MSRSGIKPEITNDPEEALAFLSRDGAVVLRDQGSSGADCVAAAQRLMGDRLRAWKEPVGIVESTKVEPGDTPRFSRETRSVHSDVTRPMMLHADGFAGHGEACPDYVFLLCERQAMTGGASFMVDGYRILSDLTADPDSRDLTEFLWSTAIHQSRNSEISLDCPIARKTDSGRIALLRHGYQTPLPQDKDHAETTRMIALWHDLTEAEAATAPRLRLQPGDMLCLDNYRIFHSRDPFPQGGDRLLHRVWAWSDSAGALPLDIGGNPIQPDITNARNYMA